MMTKEGSNKIVNFMTPGAGALVLERGHMSYSETALIKQTKCIVMMTKEGFTKIVNFI